MEAVIVISCTTVLFLGMILLLAAKPEHAGKITGIFAVLVGVGSLLLYGYCFAVATDNLLLAVVRALMAVCGMYVGIDAFEAISHVPLMEYDWMHIVFWVLHLLALYITISAAVTTVGAEALKKLRLRLAQRGQINLIYGVNDGSLDLGQQLISRKNGVVVYVDAKPDEGETAAVTGMGCVLYSDSSALSADLRFFRAMGMGKDRQIVLYALSKDVPSNVAYAKKLLASLQKKDVDPARIRLVILGKDDQSMRSLQVGKDTYGYGYVSVVDEAELAARLLVGKYPPCNTITFDAQGRATEDFQALMVGFGQTGQAVLKQLVMNGQFPGSTFRIAIFDSNCQQTHGFFGKRFAALLEQYDISFHPYDARSSQMYTYLDSNADKIKFVAICAGSEKLNRELAEELTDYFRERGYTLPVCRCNVNGVKAHTANSQVETYTRLYDAELLSRDGLDKMAMLLNHRYQKDTEKTPQQTWMECDYFSRQSCRAAADYTVAMLRMAGISDKEAMQGWQPEGELLLNMSRAEHLRWNAFHYCMGFTTMSDEEFDSRSAQYLRQLQTEGKATIRIGKNMTGRTHACLVSWEALKDLSEKEARITGKYTDYQQMDTENVLELPALLRAAADSEQ